VRDGGLKCQLQRTTTAVESAVRGVFQSGPVAIDVGYRYKKILASGAASTLNSGDYHVNDVRIGVGFSF